MPVSRLTLLLLVSTAVLVGCSEAPAPSARTVAEPAVRVLVEPVTFEPALTRIEAVGTSRASLSAELFPAASGEVVAIAFEPGQFVHAGDVLVELDRRREVLAEKLAEVNLADAERLYDRYRRAADSGAVVPAVLDEARTATELARVELERARIALADRTIRAVFDGHVGTTEIDPGDRIGPDTLITTLDDRSSLLVNFEVPEALIGALAVGDEVRLETWAASLPEVTGQIVDISSRVDPRTRRFVARARVDNASDTLRPGMSFRVRASVEGARYAVVAETALQWGADGAYLWTIAGGEAARLPVRVIERRDGRVLVDGELERGDVIVVEGTHRVRDGTAVRFSDRQLVRERPPLTVTDAAGGGPRSAAWD
ncbi:MAG: efflux RND transporter periplasmic adaptor subunit [Woeseiaceae bacterium]|nr:efflux RND transporter periplasmic adaptor subunit [Woeseiaceae bacterium]